jgi:hypothetical protein
MSPEAILLLLRLTNVGLNILTEIDALIKRVQAGEEITDAEIEASGKRVDEAVANWNAASQKKET